MKSLTSVRTATSPSLYFSKHNQFPGYDHLTLLQHLSENRKIYFHGHSSKKIQCSLLVLDKTIYRNWKEMYNWRSTTELPIVKTFFLDILEQNDNEIKVNLFHQYCPQRLSDFSEIPLSQILYLLKESLIGFERLYSKLSGFEVNSSMIAINDSKKCKVWINEDFTKNEPKKITIDEQQYISRIIDIYSAFVLRTGLSRQFFQGFSNIKKFVKAFNYIDTFATKNRILIPSRFMLQPRSSSQHSFIYRQQLFANQQDKKSNGSNQKRSWNKSQKLSLRKNSNSQAHFLDLSQQKTLMNNAMKYSNGTNGTTDANSTNQLIFSNTKQISSGYEDYEGQLQERAFISPQQSQVNRKTQCMFRSEINELTVSDMKQKQRKFNSQYKLEQQLKGLKISHELEQIKQEKNSNFVGKLWNPFNKQITSEQESFEQQQNAKHLQIFRKNGWENKINNLIAEEKEIKESVTIGKDIPSAKKIRNLQLLNQFGRHIGNSRLSNDFSQ